MNDTIIDPPLTTVLANKLYLGDLYDSTNEDLLNQNGITCIINVSRHEGNSSNDYNNYWLPLIDGDGNEQYEFDNAVSVLTDMLNKNEVVLIHCLAGISRSATVLCCWWAKTNNISFDEAKEIIKLLRPINPHYKLEELAKKYLGEI